MLRLTGSLLALSLAGAPLIAQQRIDTAAGPRCSVADTIKVVGNSRIDEGTIRGTVGLIPHANLNFRDVQHGIQALFATGDFDDVNVVCSTPPATPNTVLTIVVKERPTLSATTFEGIKNVSSKDVHERAELPIGSPVDPSAIANAVTRIDSLYESEGYYLAKVHVDSTISMGQLKLAFQIDEGHRVAISGVGVGGNRRVPTSAIVGAMQTRPEGFWWFRTGEFDEGKFAGDLTDRIPKLYGSRGYIDFRILRDTMVVNRENGKGFIQLDVAEGPRYTIGSFEINGNRQLPTDYVEGYYPFSAKKTGRSLAESTLGFFRRSYSNPSGTFDRGAWDDATDKLQEAYQNEGYLSAQIQPIVERVPSSDSVHKVNLRWDIREGPVSIVNRIDIDGNDFTSETCIRQQILMIPGGVFRRDAMIQSYQNIGNLNFFEQPMERPTFKQANDSGDVDITFHVKEKRTGNINFGASMGEGTGLGGFIGLDQPNLFGKCKRAQVQWQFGKYQNDFSLTYEDPNIQLSNISGSATAYHAEARYQIADLGQSTRTGGQLQLGFPVPHSIRSRLFVNYGGEFVKYSDNTGTLLGTLATTCNNCFRSSVGATFQHDTRFGMPFPFVGGMQSFGASFNGGPLGGTANFQKYTTEFRSYSPLFQLGDDNPGSEPMRVVVGLSARGGAVMGNPGPFFSSQSFALGGTQYGEQLRGYCEFSITPKGYDPTACDGEARRDSFGNAFFVGTSELGLRVNSSLYFDAFFEGGNVWDKLREFNPTRLYRSVGFGGSTISPLGPLGLDIAYGLDRVDANGRPNPGWKVHFKLGQMF